MVRKIVSDWTNKEIRELVVYVYNYSTEEILHYDNLNGRIIKRTMIPTIVKEETLKEG